MKKLITIILILSPLAASADCVQITDPKLEPGGEDNSSLPAIKWQATLSNQCDTVVDVTLSIDLVDIDGDTVYNLSAVESLHIKEQRAVEKEVYIPGRIAEQAADVKMSTVERSR